MIRSTSTRLLARKVLPVDALYVALYDAPAQSYSIPLFWDQGAYRSLGSIKLHERPNLTQVVIERGQTLYLADLHDPATAAAYPSIKVAAAPTHTYLGVPLLMRGQVTGVLSIQNLHVDELAHGIALVTYDLAGTRRMSLWVKEVTGWYLRYHQATPIA